MAAAGRAAMFAYVADVAAPKERTRYFGLLAAAGGIGTVLGPASAASSAKSARARPFWAAAVVGFVNAAYGFVVLKELLPKSKRIALHLAARQSVRRAVDPVRGARACSALAVIMMLANIGMSAFTSIYVLYVNYRYHWGAGLAGLVLMAYAATNIPCQGVLAGPVAKRLGEQGAIVLAFLSGSSGLALIGARRLAADAVDRRDLHRAGQHRHRRHPVAALASWSSPASRAGCRAR